MRRSVKDLVAEACGIQKLQRDNSRGLEGIKRELSFIGAGVRTRPNLPLPTPMQMAERMAARHALALFQWA